MQGQADVVETIQQAVFPLAIDREGDHLAGRGGHGLCGQVDIEAVALGRLGLLEQAIDHIGGQHDGQDAILEAVVEEDIGEGGRDDGAKTIVFQRPRRMFARRTATEVLPCQQDRGALVTRLIEHEIRIQRAIRAIHARLAAIEIAPFVERIRAEAGTLDRLQELLGDDRVGIDVGTIKRSDQAVKAGERLHRVDLWMASPAFSMSWPIPCMVLQP